MPLIIQRVFLFAALLLVPVRSIEAQIQAPYRLMLPFVTRPALALTGEWVGAATQTGNVFDYALSLTTNGTDLLGFVRVSDGAFYARMALSGSLVGEQLLLDATRITETNGAPTGSRWCIPTLLLTPDEGTTLVGTWKQDGCNSGKVYLQRTTAQPVTVAGRWGGTASQRVNTFGYTVTLNQNGRLLTGLTTTRNGATFGTMRVRGYVVGNRILVQETQLLEGSSTAWCFKTVELQRSAVGGAVQLQGPWSATGCTPGEVALTAQ